MIDDWEDLLEIPTEDNGDSTRRTIWGVGEVTAHPVHGFEGISVPEKSNSVVEVHPVSLRSIFTVLARDAQRKAS